MASVRLLDFVGVSDIVRIDDRMLLRDSKGTYSRFKKSENWFIIW
jgi:hypothetical protein